MKVAIAIALVGLSLTACSRINQCIQPDPLEPAHGHPAADATNADRVPVAK